MPFVRIPMRAVEKLVELRAKARETDKTWDIAFQHGFMEGLKAIDPDCVGLVIMEADSIEMDIPGLPRLVLATGDAS